MLSPAKLEKGSRPEEVERGLIKEDEAQVFSLHHQTLPPAIPESNFARIQELKASRRLKQDAAHGDYEAFISDLSGNALITVLTPSNLSLRFLWADLFRKSGG